MKILKSTGPLSRPNVSQRFGLSLLLVSSFFSTALSADELDKSGDQTEAPYFWVRGADEQIDSLPLKATDVQVKIEGTMAKVVIRQTYRNEGELPIEASYVFPGSTRAAVSDLLFRVGERTIRAEIQEKEEARKTYEKAKQEGKRTTLLEQHRPNVFQMKVANILPSDTVEVELTYTETLERADGLYEFVFPTVVGPRYSEDPKTGGNTAWISSPFIQPDAPAPTAPTFEMAIQILQGGRLSKVGSPTHEIDADYITPNEAIVQMLHDTSRSDNRDFILRFSLADAEPAASLLVQNDDEGGYFFLNIEPPARASSTTLIPREYLFLLDVSGSMSGFPLDISKEIIGGIVSDLRKGDSFNIFAFAGGAEVFSPGGSVSVDEATRSRALHWIKNQRGGGGTRILPAMEKILSEPKPEGRSRSIIVLTDGYVTVEHKTFELIRKSLGEANLFSIGIGSSVNRHLIEGMARAGAGEAFIATNPDEGRTMVSSFLDMVQNPILTDIEIEFDGVAVREILPAEQPDLFSSRPLRMIGQFEAPLKGTLRIKGLRGPELFEQEISLEDLPTEAESLDILWAREKIRALSDDLPFLGEEKVRSAIVALGLKHRLLTQFTSFVAVEEVVARTESDLHPVKQPLPLPKGVSKLAVGGGVPASPEPATWGLVILTVLAIAYTLIRSRSRKGV